MTTSKRRDFLRNASFALAGAAMGAVASAQDASPPKRRIIGISTSHRPGMTCAAGLKFVLDSVKTADPSLETELIELADMNIGMAVVGGDQPKDDLDPVLERIAAPECVGIVIASPVYFGLPSARCVAMINRMMPIKKALSLKNKILGLVACGGSRNGGQETVLHALTGSLVAFQMILAVDAPPTSHWGATFWNQKNSIAEDEFGISTAKNLGIRMAELAKLVS